MFKGLFQIIVLITPIAAQPLPLKDLCRRVIRQNLTKERIADGKIDSLVLPRSIKEYLEYKDRRPGLTSAASTVTSAGSPIKSS